MQVKRVKKKRKKFILDIRTSVRNNFYFTNRTTYLIYKPPLKKKKKRIKNSANVHGNNFDY